jgi:polyvinyl alcohol dehydrogenase (cytochrome)
MRYIFTLALLLATACTHAADCPSTPGNERFFSNSWGISSDNSRYQSSANTSITADNVDELELAWVFGFEDSESPHSYPLITEDTVYIGSDAGILYALERETGCLRWRFQADGDIRTAIVHGRVEHKAVTHTLLFFGTLEGSVYALNALSGDQVWQKEIDPHRFAMVTGTPVFHQGRLFVPVSSYELMVAAVPFYECCDFRGSGQGQRARQLLVFL